MSKRVYLAITTGEPAPFALQRWDIAKTFGWTLEYIDNLPLSELHEYTQVEDGLMKSRSDYGAKNSNALRRNRR